MKTNLSKKTRALVEQYILRHASLTCNIRRPYVVATCNMGNLSCTGIGIAKWNPNDAGVSKWEWNEPRGCDIAIGRAVVDLIRLASESHTLSSYIEVAELEQKVASKEDKDDDNNDTDAGFIGYYLKKEKESSNEEYPGPSPAAT